MQMKDLKEAEQKSLKESERLEKEITEVQEMKVNKCFVFIYFLFDVHTKLECMVLAVPI
jgi:F-type H+-transporting ATPase subunit d